MATTEEKQRIKELAAKGKSVNTIKDKLELPKSTVYYHFKKEVGQKQKENRLKIPEDEEVKGEICGIFAGDGNYYEDKNYKYRVKFTLNINDNYWKNLAAFLENSLDKKPRVNHQENYNRTNLRYESKELIDFLREKLDWSEEDKTGTIRLGSLEYSQEFKIGFLRGLLDTDGFVSKKQNRITFNSISKNLTENVSEILEERQIDHEIVRDVDKRESCRDMYRARITGDKVKELIRIIEPRHPKKGIQ
ncbi:LAGLIDADG family homing endonuclease [Candidatus Nanohalobium constans]|uniref:DOD-type homing endonuclease domain-containing protein n=1 Tax=Candidatus Nanohalobium constans TaxID=2565781 RepID=A0A5Q0UHA7_9ARCH|nr:LAGLIDADG family homing endonuclease [Candidatus Nanohalobium constans]QGA81007.1 hypothetical protein LC1Nh_1139 [Candidatus Nanohalobium constans]